jgi:hypothetical protein
VTKSTRDRILLTLQISASVMVSARIYR